MGIKNHLTELGQKMGIERLALDEDNCCRLVFDGSVIVDMEYIEEEQKLYVYSPVCPLPIQDKALFYEDLLKANMFAADTNGSSFAVNEVAGGVILNRVFKPDQMDFNDFCQKLELFVSTVETWMEKLHVEGLETKESKKQEAFLSPDQYTIIRG